MTQLVVRGFIEKGGDLFVTVLAGLFGEHAVTVGGLRFAGECFEQVLLGQGSSELVVFHDFCFLYDW